MNEVFMTQLSEENRDKALVFIKKLSNAEYLRYVTDYINDIMRTLILKACEDNKKEKEETLFQLYYLTKIADALVYIAGNNLYGKEE